LREQGLARTGRADQQDVALGQLDLVLLVEMLQALVVVVHSNRENFLRAFLTNHILVKDFTDFLRTRQIGLGQARLDTRACCFIANDFVAQVDTFITDEHRRAGNQFFNLMLALAAKRAIQQLFAVRTFLVRHRCVSLRTLDYMIRRLPQPRSWARPG
jgi:hypothetical protein